MIRGVCAAKRPPSWQDLRAVYSQKAICRAFRIHGARILPGRGAFPVPGPFLGYIERKNCHGLPPGNASRRNIAAAGRWGTHFASIFHRRAPGNAPGHNLATTGRPRRTPHAPRPYGSRSAHGAERPLVPCHSAMYRNVMRRSATDARAERSRPCPTRPTLMPPPRLPRHYGAMRRTRRFCRR